MSEENHEENLEGEVAEGSVASQNSEGEMQENPFLELGLNPFELKLPGLP